MHAHANRIFSLSKVALFELWWHESSIVVWQRWNCNWPEVSFKSQTCGAKKREIQHGFFILDLWSYKKGIKTRVFYALVSEESYGGTSLRWPIHRSWNQMRPQGVRSGYQNVLPQTYSLEFLLYSFLFWRNINYSSNKYSAKEKKQKMMCLIDSDGEVNRLFQVVATRNFCRKKRATLFSASKKMNWNKSVLTLKKWGSIFCFFSVETELNWPKRKKK